MKVENAANIFYQSKRSRSGLQSWKQDGKKKEVVQCNSWVKYDQCNSSLANKATPHEAICLSTACSHSVFQVLLHRTEPNLYPKKCIFKTSNLKFRSFSCDTCCFSHLAFHRIKTKLQLLEPMDTKTTFSLGSFGTASPFV